MSTYTEGFRFKAKAGQPLTKDGVIRLCRLLEGRFGAGNSFEPEASGDGFLLWCKWAGKDESEYGYKCMRATNETTGGGEWPLVDRDAMTSWVGDGTVAVDIGDCSTFLKAFGSAPGWTLRELRIVEECLEECSSHKVYRMPKASSLVCDDYYCV
jgi:hypothetical protein